MALVVQFLGTGTSVGVPQIGCTCPVCTSKDPRDRRRRSGVYVRTARTAFLIDTPPDLREACLTYGVNRVEAILITHAHMDHVAGFDDVRRFNTLNGGVPMRCYAAPETIASLRAIFPYIREEGDKTGLFRPMISFAPVEGAFTLADVEVEPIPVIHGPRTNGYVISSEGRRFAYVPDCHEIPPASLDRLKGVDVLVLDCLREREHPTHLTLAANLAYMEAIRPGRGYLTHLCHDLSYEQISAKLPPQVYSAYDGLTLEV